MLAVAVEAFVKVLPRVVRILQKVVVLLQNGVHARSRVYPLDDALRLDAAPVAPAAALGEVGAAHLGDVAVLILDDLVGADDVGVFEAHVAAQFQAVILGGRVEGEVAPVDVELAREAHLSRARFGVELVDIEVHFLAPLVVGDNELQGIGDRHGAGRMRVEIVADDRFEVADLALGVGFGDARAFAEVADGGSGHAAVSQPRQGRHAGVVPAVHGALLDELFQVPLAHDEVGDVEAGKFDLPRLGRKPQIDAHPIIEGAVIFEFEGAEGVRHALQIVADGMRVVVHGIDAPLIARAVMGNVQDAVDDGVAQVEVGRRHVDLGTQALFAVRVLALPHLAEEAQVFLDRAVPERALLPGLGERAARIFDLLGGEVAHERLAV